MHFHIITLFPESFESYLKTSIIGRAIREKKIQVSLYNPRDFTADVWRRVDRRPYGGGPGMVLEAPSMLKAVEKAVKGRKGAKIIFFSPGGKQFDTAQAQKFAKNIQHLVLIAGHYEGVDARVEKITKAERLSIGPYTLTGGELPALVVMDAVVRRLPGVLGNELSLEEERTASHEVYTRPESLVYKKKTYRVPKVLFSGHHKNIEAWKKKKR